MNDFIGCSLLSIFYCVAHCCSLTVAVVREDCRFHELTLIIRVKQLKYNESIPSSQLPIVLFHYPANVGNFTVVVPRRG